MLLTIIIQVWLYFGSSLSGFLDVVRAEQEVKGVEIVSAQLVISAVSELVPLFILIREAKPDDVAEDTYIKIPPLLLSNENRVEDSALMTRGTDRKIGRYGPRSDERSTNIPKRPKGKPGSYSAYYENSERPQRHISLSIQIALGLISLAGGLFLFNLAFRKQGIRKIGTEGAYPPVAIVLIFGGALAVAFGIASP